MRCVLVTGAKGQLGCSIRKLACEYPQMQFIFKDSGELDITYANNVNELFSQNHFDYCVNCAAYTNVEAAEKNPDKAYAVNAAGVKFLAQACKKYSVVLFHISTDYVFDGRKTSVYDTADIPNPINVYGASKLKGEKHVQEILESYFIIRTSWLYSEFGKNFYKTILEKAKTEKVLQVTDKQTGCPTHASNLAIYILRAIVSKSEEYGVHHYTDGKAMTWYGFAEKILSENGLTKLVHLEKAKNYATFAQRPKNSVLYQK